ncbi:MAG TPA: hypothetical protein VFB38_20450 [Chthonomonadaceae bacterium]|nr:hypothetical protein [Chthonomonadaceae bacterium]
MFQPVQGYRWYGYIAGALLVSLVVVLILQQTPPRFRKPLIRAITLLGGLFYALEFFLPTHPMPTPEDPQRVGNFLTPYVVPFGNTSVIIAAWTVGLGFINLVQVHSRRLLRGAEGAFNSAVLLISMAVMIVVHILQKVHPNAINKNLHHLLFDGALQSLDATMFSIIAFYIVSAAYRAFRVRSVEATFLLVTAVLVMLGQIMVAQAVTMHLPHNLHVEVIRDWILTKANAPATRAIAFGLGIGGLAVALRIWLGLERGSYFEAQE